MIAYTPQGLNLSRGRASVRLFKAGDGRMTLYLILQPEGGGLVVEVPTKEFDFYDLGRFEWLSGPAWERQASEQERKDVREGHRDYILRQALEQEVIRLSCTTEMRDDGECLNFTAHLGRHGSMKVEGRVSLQVLERFIDRTELIPAK